MAAVQYEWDIDEEEEVGEEEKYSGKNLTVFLIEATEGMAAALAGDPDGLTGIQRALTATYSVIKSRVFTHDGDLTAVLTFGHRAGAAGGPGQTDYSSVREVGLLHQQRY